MASRQHECLEGLEVGVWYVYVDRTLDADRPFYVGKGNHERIRKQERNSHWKHIVAKHGWNLDKRQVVLATRFEIFALEQEKTWVEKLGTFEDGTPGRWGANRTCGGESTSAMSGSKNWMYGKTGNKHPRYGTKHTASSIERNRLANSGANHPSFGQSRPQNVVERIRLGNSGENSNNTHLTWTDIRRIREMYITGNWTYTELGRVYEISKGAVSKIVRGLTWKDPTYKADVSDVSNANRSTRYRDTVGRYMSIK